MEPGPNLLPVTGPDPDAFNPVTRPSHWVSVLWSKRLFLRRCTYCFLPKVPALYSTHTDDENV